MMEPKKLVLAYPNWGDFYIQSVTDPIQKVYWENQKLTIIVNGTEGATGQITIHCGSRGIPEKTTGFTSTYYNANTETFQGTFKFQSPAVLTLSWTKTQGGTYGPPVQFSIATSKITAYTGETTNFNLTIQFNTYQIQINYIKFTKNPEWFKVLTQLPKTYKSKGIQTTIQIQCQITIPKTTQPRQVTIPIAVYAQSPNGQLTTGGALTINIKQPTSNTETQITRMLGNPTILLVIAIGTAWLSYYSLKKR